LLGLRWCVIFRVQLGHEALILSQANLPNLRRLFVDARTEAEESSYSRNAVCTPRSAVIYFSRLICKVLQSNTLHVFGCCVQSNRSADEWRQDSTWSIILRTKSFVRRTQDHIVKRREKAGHPSHILQGQGRRTLFYVSDDSVLS